MVQLGTTVFDLSAQMLRDSTGAKIALRAQSARVLEYLIEAKGALVSKDELFKAVWPGVSVTDDSLVQCIREIRYAIGDPDHKLLQTEVRRGYRLIADAYTTSPAPLDIQSPAVQTAGTGIALAASQAHSIENLVPPAIAVLAFASMQGDERSERLAVTFAGDLITQLARHKELRVVGRFSAFSLQWQKLSTKEVCERLNARYIVSGQVQFNETTIDWSLEMMDGHNDELVWSERTRVSFSDVYIDTTALFGRIAGAIVASFSAFTLRNSITKAPDSLNAYDLCARAMAISTRDTPQSAREAQQLATQAVTLYPHFAPAWRTLAMVHAVDIVLSQTGQWTDVDIPQVLKEVYKAIELDDTQASAFGVLANLLSVDGQHAQALLASQRGMALAPNDPLLLHFHAVVLFYAGRFEESKALSESLLSNGPLRQSAYLAGYGRTLFAMGQCDTAINTLQEALSMSPGLNTGRITLIAALEETGQHASAIQHFDLLLANSQHFINNHFGRRWSAISEVRARYLVALQAHSKKVATLQA